MSENLSVIKGRMPKSDFYNWIEIQNKEIGNKHYLVNSSVKDRLAADPNWQQSCALQSAMVITCVDTEEEINSLNRKLIGCGYRILSRQEMMLEELRNHMSKDDIYVWWEYVISGNIVWGLLNRSQLLRIENYYQSKHEAVPKNVKLEPLITKTSYKEDVDLLTHQLRSEGFHITDIVHQIRKG